MNDIKYLSDFQKKYNSNIYSLYEVFYFSPLFDNDTINDIKSVNGNEFYYDIAINMFCPLSIIASMYEYVAINLICFSVFYRGKSNDGYITCDCKNLTSLVNNVKINKIHKALNSLKNMGVIDDMSINRCLRFVLINNENYLNYITSMFNGYSVKIFRKVSSLNKKEFAQEVYLTDDEYNNLIKKYGEEKTNGMINILSAYKMQHGRKYKSDYHAMLVWVDKAYDEKKQKESRVISNNVKKIKL